MKQYGKTVLLALLPILIAVFSVLRLAGPMSSPEMHKDTIQYLEDRRTVVLELTGASTAASVAVTLLPGDAGTPIAEKLADLSSAFLVIMSALVLEKYLVTVTGYVFFCFLIPLACFFFSWFILSRRDTILWAAIKIFLFGLALFLLVPVSVRLSRFIETTYQDLQVAVDTALEQDQTDLLEDVSDAPVAATQSSTGVPGTASATAQGAAAAQIAQATADSAAQSNTEESRAWWQRAMDLLSGHAEETGSAVQQQIERIKSDVAGIAEQVTVAPEKLSRLLNHYIEVVSVLIVTSCVIPVLELFLFYTLIKMVFGLEAPHFTSLFLGKRQGK